MNDILMQIRSDLPSFSKGQKRIANYILESYDKAAFMTASRLGKMVEVSESTVVRFAVELGFDGYPSMQKTLQELVRNKLTSVQRIEVTNDRLGNQDVVSTVLQGDIDSIRMTSEALSRSEMDASVQAILQAKTIYIVGMRSSTALASFMGFYLNQMLENVRLVHDTSVSEVYEQVFRIGEGDVFIGISYPRYSSKTIKAMEFAKSTGATAIGITDGDSSPFVGVADVILYAKSDMVSFLDSLVAPMSLINALIVAVGYQRPDNLSDTYHRLEKIWSEYDVYEKLDD